MICGCLGAAATVKQRALPSRNLNKQGSRSGVWYEGHEPVTFLTKKYLLLLNICSDFLLCIEYHRHIHSFLIYFHFPVEINQNLLR